MNANNQAVIVSVIMPLYNMEAFLKTSIESVLEQTFSNFELIIVDDGSTDNSVQIVCGFSDKRIKYFKQMNLGVSSARNFGILNAQGKYCAFLDPDDIWLSNKLEIQITAMEKEEIACSGTLMSYLNLNSDFFGVCGEDVSLKQEDVASGNLMPFALSSMIVRSDILNTVGLFNENFLAAEDHELLSRIANETEIYTIMQKLGGYRIHGQSLSNKKYMIQGILSMYVVHLRASDKISINPISIFDFIEKSVADKKLVKKIKARHYFRQSGSWFISKNYFKSFFYLTLGFATNPKYVLVRLFFRFNLIIKNLVQERASLL